MNLQGKSCAVEPFSAAQAVIKAQFDPASIEATFNSELVGRLSSAGLLVSEPHPGLGQADVTVEGRFVLIDEGSRAQRYLLTGIAGAAVLEVEGRLFFGDVPASDLHVRTTKSAGVFGGSAEGLLKGAATDAARRIADLVTTALKER